MAACQTPLLVFLLVSLLTKSQELPVTQLARHVYLFHLVITDNWRPETLSPSPMVWPLLQSPLLISAKLLHPEPEGQPSSL
jgi:hypothetical protein